MPNNHLNPLGWMRANGVPVRLAVEAHRNGLTGVVAMPPEDPKVVP